MAFVFRAYTRILEKKPLLVTCISSAVCYTLGDQLAQNIEIKTNKRVNNDYHRTINMTIFGLSVGGPLYYIWFKKVHHINKLFEKIIKWNYERQLSSKLINSFSKHIKNGNIDNMSMKEFREVNKMHFDKIMITNEMVFRSKTILAGQVYADQFIFSAIYPVIFMMCTGLMIDNTKREDLDYLIEHKMINIDKIISSFNKNWNNVKDKYITIYMADCAFWPLFQIGNFAFVPPIYQAVLVNGMNIFWNAFICFVSQGH